MVSAGEWLVFGSPGSYSENSIAGVYFDTIVGHKLEFAGWKDQNIWATGKKIAPGEVSDVGQVPPPDLGSLVTLMGYADL